MLPRAFAGRFQKRAKFVYNVVPRIFQLEMSKKKEPSRKVPNSPSCSRKGRSSSWISSWNVTCLMRAMPFVVTSLISAMASSFNLNFKLKITWETLQTSINAATWRDKLFEHLTFNLNFQVENQVEKCEPFCRAKIRRRSLSEWIQERKTCVDQRSLRVIELLQFRNRVYNVRWFEICTRRGVFRRFEHLIESVLHVPANSQNFLRKRTLRTFWTSLGVRHLSASFWVVFREWSIAKPKGTRP